MHMEVMKGGKGGWVHTIGQLSALVYSERDENARWACDVVRLCGPFGSVRIAEQLLIAAISPLYTHNHHTSSA